jgi:hypothetical protein
MVFSFLALWNLKCNLRVVLKEAVHARTPSLSHTHTHTIKSAISEFLVMWYKIICICICWRRWPHTRSKYWAFCESAALVIGADVHYSLIVYKYSSNHKAWWIMFLVLFYFLCYHLDPFYGTDLFKFAIYAVLSFENGTVHSQGIIAGICHRLRNLGTAFV